MGATKELSRQLILVPCPDDESDGRDVNENAASNLKDVSIHSTFPLSVTNRNKTMERVNMVPKERK